MEHMFRNPVSRGSGGGYGGDQEKEEGMASEVAPFDLDRVVSEYKMCLCDVLCIIFCYLMCLLLY